MCRALIFVFATSATVYAGSYKGFNRVQLVGNIIPGIADGVKVTLETESGSSLGCLAFEIPRDVICEASFVPLGARSARVTLHARGYKTFTLNLPSLRYGKDLARVNIGNVRLIKSDLPFVHQVIAGQRPDGARVFELTLVNRLATDVLIKKLRVEAYRGGDGMACCCPPTSVFEIRDRLHVIGGGKGVLSAGGSYSETVRGSDFAVDITAEIKRFECDGSVGVELLLPVSFVIPKSSTSAVHIVVPRRFKVTRTSYCCTSPEFYPVELPASDDDATLLDSFEGFRFFLSTEQKDELDLEARYPPSAAAQR